MRKKTKDENIVGVLVSRLRKNNIEARIFYSKKQAHIFVNDFKKRNKKINRILMRVYESALRFGRGE
jgi:hypothetical protein